MGKTADGAIWLDKKFLSPYDYWQFWRNTDDRDVVKFLKFFTDEAVSDIEKLKKSVSKMISGDVNINILEVKKPELDYQLVADNIAQQLEKRVAFRRAMKRAVQSAMRLGALGVRINCAGRLGGAEIARTEWYREGRVPLHTLRADVDYGEATAFTTYGTCGIKVWVFKGEVMAHDPMAQDKRLAEQQSGPAPRSNG